MVATAPRGIIVGCDVYVLESFCVQTARFREADRQIKRSSLLVKGADGNAVTNPLIRICNQANALAHRAGTELGLSPISRTRLIGSVEEQPDVMELLLGPAEDNELWSGRSRPRH